MLGDTPSPCFLCSLSPGDCLPPPPLACHSSGLFCFLVPFGGSQDRCEAGESKRLSCLFSHPLRRHSQRRLYVWIVSSLLHGDHGASAPQYGTNCCLWYCVEYCLWYCVEYYLSGLKSWGGRQDLLASFTLVHVILDVSIPRATE